MNTSSADGPAELLLAGLAGFGTDALPSDIDDTIPRTPRCRVATPTVLTNLRHRGLELTADAPP